jgi:anti-anti-sigma factor
MSRIDITSDLLPDGTRVIKPVGKLDVFSFTELKKYIEDLCASAQAILVVVDLSAVDYIASSGWSVLLSRRQAIRRLAGDLSICGLNADLKRVYDTMRIEKMLPSAASLAEATKLLKAPETA